MSEPHRSEIARFREQQALEEESARMALTGYAITARHDFIIARAQRGAERILRLIDEGKHEEAQALMNTENWGIENLDTTARGKGKGKNKSKGGKENTMHKAHLNRVPTLALSFHDLIALRGIIRAYITYTRRTSQPTSARQEQLNVLEALYTRLTSVPANVSDIAFLLSIAEVAALSGAIKGFCTFIRNKVPPSQERDETLQEVERMREILLQML